MPAPKTHALNPVSIAETILGLLAAVPGDRACFLESARSGAIKLHSALINSPDVDRWHSTPNYSWVGTYRLGATSGQVVEDIREVLGRVR